MFKAVKPCNFAGTDYRIGDHIPEGVVLETAVMRLIKSGVIAEVGNAGLLLPASTSIEDEESVQEEKEEPSANILFTERSLMGLNRGELVEIATNLGMEVDDSHTKRMLTAYILEVKQGSDE